MKKANIPEEKEFEFCDEKIQKNFSNYSSWHYRSQLLPILYPHETDKSRPISEEKLKEELELVITAAFTDPNDSSAWFYQRWLLGYSDPEFDLATVKISNRKVVATFTKAIDLNEEGIKISCSPLGDLSTCSWVSVSGEKFDTAWQLEGEFKQPQENCFKIIFEVSFFH